MGMNDRNTIINVLNKITSDKRMLNHADYWALICGEAAELLKEDERAIKFQSDRLDELLKAQEPHILTKDDFNDNPKCDGNGCLPVWVEYRTGHCGWTKTSAETMYVGMFAWGRQKYRYWTDKPTKEQMKEMKWDD